MLKTNQCHFLDVRTDLWRAATPATVDGEMWCYQKPGFEALLLAELQRQQQCSQFCDTLLKTGCVSVPAHSCILSAISPHISSVLSSMPPPIAGQSRLLEFPALSTCTLLHMVRLLYSGEMAGEGEEEKQKAISAAAKLGIHGLVEVTKRHQKSRHEEGEGQHAEVGVQTEPPMPEGRRSRWRREVWDGSTFLWKQTLSDGEKDTWTQTEELQIDAAPPSHPAATFETIDMTALQSLRQTDPHLPPPQIPYIPISLVYPLDENQTHQPSSTPVVSVQESTAAGHTSVAAVAPPYTSVPPSLLPFFSQATPHAASPQSWLADPQSAARDDAAAKEREDEYLEQFQGNIPGYINHFLNPDKEEGFQRGRPKRRQGAGAGGARKAGTGGRGARRPQARTGGRMRGRLTQTVDVQEVGVSKLQMWFLQRRGMRVTRTGQGGGAAGRKLYLKTRELLKAAKSRQRRRGCSKVWEFSLSRDLLPYSEGGAGNKQRGWRNTTFPHKLNESSSFQPPPAPPPPGEQPEHIHRLLEEVMMDFEISPYDNNSGAPHSQTSLPASSSSRTYASSGNNLAPNKQQGQTTGFSAAAPGFYGSTQVVAVAREASDSSSANSEVPVLQQQAEGELNEMLEHFLQSFEQHLESCIAREEQAMGGQSCSEAPVRGSQIPEQQQNDEAETPVRHSQPCKASAHSAVPPKHTEGILRKVRAPAKQEKKRRKNEYLLSLKKKKVGVWEPAALSNAKANMVHDRGDKQLQQMPVVKLMRSGPLPVRVGQQGHSCQSLEVKSLAKTQTSSSSLKIYPLRSRFREKQTDSIPFFEEPLVWKQPPSAGQPRRKRGRPKKNAQLFSLSNGESSTPQIQPQPVHEQLENSQERREERSTVRPREEAGGPTRRGKKRGTGSGEEETGDDATVAKRICIEQMQEPTSDTGKPSSESADFEPATAETADDVIDVETVSLTGVRDCLQSEGRGEKTMWSEIKLRETEESLMGDEVEGSCDEIIDVDGDEEDDWEKEVEKDRRSRTALPYFVEVKPSVSHSEVSLGSTGSWEGDNDEDIDVIGGSSPVPEPVIISWTSDGDKEEEDEDIDVV